MNDNCYKVKLNNGETVFVGAASWMVAPAVAIKQYLKENPDYDGPELRASDVLPWHPAEGGRGADDLIEVRVDKDGVKAVSDENEQQEMVDHHLTNILQNARASAIQKCGDKKGGDK